MHNPSRRDDGRGKPAGTGASLQKVLGQGRQKRRDHRQRRRTDAANALCHRAVWSWRTGKACIPRSTRRASPYREDAEYQKAFERMVTATDLVMLDLKAMDAQLHRASPGWIMRTSSAMARKLSDIGKPMWIRHVLVPGLTDGEDDLQQMAGVYPNASNRGARGDSAVSYAGAFQMAETRHRLPA